ncbi:MAG: DUF99 family protein [Thermoplasmata archaeon]|nr:DUF99 family protein [Thermoplasmata archaeon]
MGAARVGGDLRIGRKRRQSHAAPRASQVDRRRHSASPRGRGSKVFTRALAKPHLRVIGLDDGPFVRSSRRAALVGVVFSTPNYVEGILRTSVAIDGTDATERILALLGTSPFLDGVRAVILDGIAVGGFNLIDLDRLYEGLQRPIVTVTRRSPDFPAIRTALRKYFPRDAPARWRLVRAHALFRLPTSQGNPLRVSAVGCTRAQAAAIVRRTTMRGNLPEPLRLARLIARALGGPDGAARPAPRPAPKD